jgi:endoglucanase
MLAYLLAQLLHWNYPNWAYSPAINVSDSAVTEHWPQLQTAPAQIKQPLRQVSPDHWFMPPAAAAQGPAFQAFGQGLHWDSVTVPDLGAVSGTGQLLASTQGPLVGHPLSLVFLNFDPRQTGLNAELRVEHAFMVKPTILGLRIEDGQVVRGRQMPYRPRPEDRVDKDNWVQRNGEFLGYLVSEEESIIRTVDQRIGERLDPDWAGKPGNYRITSPEDSRYSNGVKPMAVYRKTKPVTIIETGGDDHDWLLRHTIYLQVDQPLRPGQRYQIDFTGNPMDAVSFVYDPLSLRSEAVQVSHIGFAPNDPAKVAFLSTWLGDGGPLSYEEDLTFYVVDEATNEIVFEGPVELSKKAGEPEDKRDRDYTGTDVFLMDFSALNTPGRYRVAVEGVGTSFPFDIQPDVWESAFYVSVRGLLHQRSGIELGPPYTDYERPRPFHPQDGVKIYQSTVPLMETRMGLKGDVNVFEALKATRTEELVPEAWGGWFDAGDWDRRIQHLEVSLLLLELALLHPDYFSQITLNLPESDNALPDVVDEALWGLDVFKRLQLPNGAIRGGIESAEHPKSYEASWQESLTVMVYGPDVWSSYTYAGVAARAAYVLQDLNPQLAAEYRDSALKAMVWAETSREQGQGEGYEEVANQRNLAAAELYRLTGDEKWHQLFLTTTVFQDPEAETAVYKSHDQRHAAFVYVQTRRPGVNPAIQKNAREAIVREAEGQQEAIANTGYRWYKHPSAPMGWGSALGGLKLTNLLRAYNLTEDKQYLASAILAAQFSLGANPDNMAYTTGLGYRSPQDPLIKDIQATGQLPPPGITIYGPLDILWRKDYWTLNLLKEATYPDPWSWPTVESHFDVFNYVPVSEFTVMQTIAPTAYGLGFLAAEQD